MVVFTTVLLWCSSSSAYDNESLVSALYLGVKVLSFHMTFFVPSVSLFYTEVIQSAPVCPTNFLSVNSYWYHCATDNLCSLVVSENKGFRNSRCYHPNIVLHGSLFSHVI